VRNFCNKPWNNEVIKSNGSKTPCSFFRGEYYPLKIQENFILDIRNIECDYCWNKEDINKISPRDSNLYIAPHITTEFIQLDILTDCNHLNNISTDNILLYTTNLLPINTELQNLWKSYPKVLFNPVCFDLAFDYEFLKNNISIFKPNIIQLHCIINIENIDKLPKFILWAKFVGIPIKYINKLNKQYDFKPMLTILLKSNILQVNDIKLFLEAFSDDHSS